jgi:hypothetical protein
MGVVEVEVVVGADPGIVIDVLVLGTRHWGGTKAQKKETKRELE